MSTSSVPRVRLVHETNPRKYFPALYELARQGEIEIVGEHRYSVVKEWVRAWVKGREPFRSRTKHALADLAFRFRLAGVRDEVVVLGFAPWDWRGFIYFPLTRRNDVIYHTSWPYWSDQSVPRRLGPATPMTRRRWLRFLRDPRTKTVAVLRASAEELARRFGVIAEVIPHAVPGAFYDAGIVRGARNTSAGAPLRVAFVGELSPKKGVPWLLSFTESWAERGDIELTVIGEGPLRTACEEAGREGRLRFCGPITDRQELAEELSRNDLLLVPSQRERDWEELFGIVIVEALAAGLAVMATDHIGPRSVLGVGNPGLIAESELEQLGERVSAIASDRTILDLIRRAQGGIADRYRLGSVETAWLAVIRERVGERGG